MLRPIPELDKSLAKDALEHASVTHSYIMSVYF